MAGKTRARKGYRVPKQRIRRPKKKEEEGSLTMHSCILSHFELIFR